MNLSQNRFLHDSEAHLLFELMCDPTVEIQDFNIVDDDHLLLSSKKISETLSDRGHTNVFLASFTTCSARLKLYDLLDMLQSKICIDKLHSEIYSQEEVKKYQAVYTKRVIQTDLSRVPYLKHM